MEYDYIGNLTTSSYHLFPAKKQNLGSHRYKGDCKVETIMT